jgi:DNA-binding IclR family transcriptional regulator
LLRIAPRVQRRINMWAGGAGRVWLTCMALFVPSDLLEIGLDKELGPAEEETDAGADCAAAAAD